MIWSLIAQVVARVLDLLTFRTSAENDKNPEVLVLRQQIRILERRVGLINHKPLPRPEQRRQFKQRFADLFAEYQAT